ncbi:MAG: hypothetical protein SFV21_20845 [Rhodospirillaceae bacterium]|nr:hypothetical protein [Rhodospirillaceae bacterium]
MVHAVSDAVRVAGSTVPRATLQGIQVASAQSGVSFQYLLAKAAQESGLDADAAATTSSAKGLFQFTRGTWLDVVKRHADELGLRDVAGRILTSPGGRLTVLDKRAEADLLALRQDPEVSALAAAAYARDNAQSITTALGREPDAPELYLAHFLGAKGAASLLTAADSGPNIYAAHVVPDAAKANRSVFYADSGAPRTVRQVIELIRGRFEAQLERFADVASAWADDDNARAAEAARPAPSAGGVAGAEAPTRIRRPSDPFDLSAAVSAGDAERMSLSWYLMQELARMIAAQPMSMIGDDEPTQQDLPAAGFAGADWSTALVDQFTSRAGLPTATAATAARAYGRSPG